MLGSSINDFGFLGKNMVENKNIEENLLIIINDILLNNNKSKIEAINENTHFRDDIGFDSFSLAELTVKVEDKYGIDIFEDGIVNTVGEIKKKIVLKHA